MIIQKTPCLVSCYDPVEKCSIVVCTTGQVAANRHTAVTLILRKETLNTVLWNRRHVQVIRQNFVKVPWQISTAAARSSTDWDRLARTKVANSSILGLVRTVLGRSVRTSYSKMSLPCTIFCDTCTALRPKALSTYIYLTIWKVSLVNFPNFWHNFTFVLAQKATSASFETPIKLPFKTESIVLLCTHLLLERGKNWLGFIPLQIYEL